MNLNYSSYYVKSEIPADYKDPQPIYFLTVENVVSDFLIDLDDIKDKQCKKYRNRIFQNQSPLEVVKESLHTELNEMVSEQRHHWDMDYFKIPKRGMMFYKSYAFTSLGRMIKG